MKQFMRLLCLLSLCLVSINTLAYDFSAKNDDGIVIYYRYIKPGAVAVSYSYFDSYQGNVVIPEYVKHSGHTYEVTAISEKAFQDCKLLKSITIPRTITSIGEWAFHNCDSLSSVSIGIGVTTIGNSAFSGCTSLSSVSIGNSVTTIGGSAFSGCISLSSVSIGNSVTTIGGAAFSGCTSLSSVSIGNSVTKIGDAAFKYCTSLTSITLPNTITYIGNESFYGCTSLSSITLPNTITYIGNESFRDCKNLSSIFVDDLNSLWNIKMGEDVFLAKYDRLGFKSYYSFHLFLKGKEVHDLIVPNTVDTIRKGFFSNCLLGSVTIPNHVKEIEEGAFYYCGLSSLKINMQLQPDMEKIFGMNLQSIEIGNDVKNIPSNFYSTYYYTNGYLFTGSQPLRSVTIGTNVISIGKNAFSKLDGLPILSKVIFLSNLSVKDYWVRDEWGLHGYTIYTKEEYPLLNSMFEVDGIKYVPISLSERTCEAIDCNYSSFVKDIHIGEYVIYNGVTMRIEKINPRLFQAHKYLENVTIDFNGETPSFEECTNLKTAILSDKVTGIGNGDFEGCSNLSFVVIPNSVTTIGPYAFYNDIKLTSIEIPSNVVSIGGSAFFGCSSLQTVTIPSKLRYIGNNAFGYCDGLTSVHIDDMGAWCNIEFINSYSNPLSYAHHLYLKGKEVKGDVIIPKGLKKIGQYVFDGCNGITTLTIPNSVDSIYNCAFNGCDFSVFSIEDGNSETKSLNINGNCFGDKSDSFIHSVYIGRNLSFDGESTFSQSQSLKYVTIGNEVTNISDEMFAGCSNLKYLKIGENVKRIGQKAFSNNTNLKNLICHATTPPVCDSNALTDINKWECKLHVPKQSIDSYKTAQQWKDFLFTEDVTDINNVNKDSPNVIHCYNLKGQTTPTFSHGVNIIKTRDGKTKKIIVK